MGAVRVAVVGLGKIARDQHLPAIDASPNFELVAAVNPGTPPLDGVACFDSLDALLQSGTAIDAIVLCTPPRVRYALARQALMHGAHVFLEKPPGATLSEVTVLEQIAKDEGLTLFAGWHSQYAAGVEPARTWLAGRKIFSISIVWKEDVRIWHPDQAWIWESGGLGVFDPGINALSILSMILPHGFSVVSSVLWTPINRASPIAARLHLLGRQGTAVSMELDWRQVGPQTWDILVETDKGQLSLQKGGALLTMPGGRVSGENNEYSRLYARFGQLIALRSSEVDTLPLAIVAEAFSIAERRSTEAFA